MEPEKKPEIIPDSKKWQIKEENKSASPLRKSMNSDLLGTNSRGRRSRRDRSQTNKSSISRRQNSGGAQSCSRSRSKSKTKSNYLGSHSSLSNTLNLVKNNSLKANYFGSEEEKKSKKSRDPSLNTFD